MRGQSDRSVDARVGLGRRDFIRAVGAAGAAWGLAGKPLSALADASPAHGKATGKAKSVIQIGIWGGMSQFETWDPKPKAAPEHRSAFKPIPTNVPGIEICETLPMMAKLADKYSILRTMLNPYTGHSTCLYVMLANAMPAGKAQSPHPASKLVYPAVGAVVGLKKTECGEYKGDIPPWVNVGRAAGSANEGFLGPKWKALSVEAAGRSRGRGDEQRMADRRGLLEAIGSQNGERSTAAQTAADLQEKMFRAMSGEAQQVFDLSQEPSEVHERYGENSLGRSLLLARRLVAYGVPFVTVLNAGDAVGAGGKRYNWDMHEQLNDSIRALCPVIDRAMSALIEDLDQRKLLDTTVVVLTPENGKAPEFATPRKPGAPHPGDKDGRGHWGSGYSCVVAGGGFKGGHAIGEMDDDGRTVQSRPIYPWDLWESIYLQLGIDFNATLPNPSGCVAPVSQAGACSLPRGGLLTEIM